MSNLSVIQKISKGVEYTTDVTIEYENEKHELVLRPLTDGELTELQALEKQSIVLNIQMKNGVRQTTSKIQDLDVNSGEFVKTQKDAIYKAVALSLSVNEEVTLDDIKQLPAGLPELIFEHVIKISKLSETDLSIVKTFRAN